MNHWHQRMQRRQQIDVVDLVVLFAAVFLLVKPLLLVALLPASKQPARPEARYGLPSDDCEHLPGYTLASYGPASTAWVAYCLEPGQVSTELRQAFHEALGVSSEFRPRLEFYDDWNKAHANWPINKGHLFFAHAAGYSPATERACFDARNILPQAEALNKGPWKAVENHEIEMRDAGWTVYAICGPLWSPYEGDSFTVEMVGDIPMAPAWFKSLVLEKDGRTAMESWIFPNRNNDLPTPDEARVSADEIERKARLQLWGLLDEPLQSELEAAK